MSQIDLSKYRQIANEINEVKHKQLTTEEKQRLSIQSANEIIKNFKSYLNSHKDELQDKLEKSLTNKAKEGYYNLRLYFSYEEDKEDDYSSYLLLRDDVSGYLLSFEFNSQIVNNGYDINEYIYLNDMKDIMVLCYRALKELLAEYGLDPLYVDNDEDLIYAKQYTLEDTEVSFVIQFK